MAKNIGDMRFKKWSKNLSGMERISIIGFDEHKKYMNAALKTGVKIELVEHAANDNQLEFWAPIDQSLELFWIELETA
jgi:hypothetical protein